MNTEYVIARSNNMGCVANMTYLMNDFKYKKIFPFSHSQEDEDVERFQDASVANKRLSEVRDFYSDSEDTFCLLRAGDKPGRFIVANTFYYPSIYFIGENGIIGPIQNAHIFSSLAEAKEAIGNNPYCACIDYDSYTRRVLYGSSAHITQS